jgi:hypothetical protein
MKKWILLAILVPGIYLCAFAQEKKIAVGLGAEFNMASRQNFAAGVVVNLIFNLPNSTAMGLSITGSMNFNNIYVLEPALLVRHYSFQDDHSGFFMQFDVGTYIALEEKSSTLMIESGLAGGYRIPIGASFYVEPYGRFGYPFAFGLGVMTGICF